MILKRGLIVSSQALDGNPLKNSESLAVMAEAAEKGGAVAIRANGFLNILAVKNRVSVPVLGLNKMKDRSGTVIITPTFESAKEIALAGSDVIAIDATNRVSEIKEDVKTLIDRIHNELHLPVLADISNVEEALQAEKFGADYVSTTLAGYTADAPYLPEEKYVPDFLLIERILKSGVKIPVIAEGRFWEARDVETAMRMGVYGIVMGKAVTNPMAITEYFNKACKRGMEIYSDGVKTEDRNPDTVDIDKIDTYSILKKINREDNTVATRVRDNLSKIATFIDDIFDNFNAGGRIVYCGAGTSARLAVADAAECAPTYGVSNDKVIVAIAGGKEAVFNASENKEDSAADGENKAIEYGITDKDTVIAVSANGNAKYCIGFLNEAKKRGAKTAVITNNKNTKLGEIADYQIVAETGAEVIKGSTRMKAGTSQKMILNMLSTTLFIKAGCVISNLMVNINPNNVKLKARAVSMLEILTDKDEEYCQSVLEQNGWSIVKSLKVIKGE